MSSAAERTLAFYGKTLTYDHVAQAVRDDKGAITEFRLEVAIWQDGKVTKRLFIGTPGEFTNKSPYLGIQEDGKHIWTFRVPIKWGGWVALFGLALLGGGIAGLAETKDALYCPMVAAGALLLFAAMRGARWQVILREVHEANCELATLSTVRQ